MGMPRKTMSKKPIASSPFCVSPACNALDRQPRYKTTRSTMNKTREELVADLRRRVADHILEPTNAALLERLIMQAVDDNEAVMIASLGTTYKRTGLHFDKRLERPTTDIHYFRRNEALSFGNDGNPHRLVIGDNLHALQNLLIQYRGQVDVIYIDPPYGKDSMEEFAETNYENDITRDNLLSMLHPRLMLARQLLSDNGVIFCSIDDRNQAYVKCLFDDVFGERNFVGTIIWQSATDNNPRQITTEHEYVICYAKDAGYLDKWQVTSKKAVLIERKYEELKKRYVKVSEIQSALRSWIKENEAELSGVTHYNNVDDKGVYSNSSNSSNTKPGGYTFDIIHPVTQKPCTKPAFGWRWKEDTFLEYAAQGDVEWGKDETTQPHIKKRIDTVTEQLKSIYYEDGRAATKLLESIFGNKKTFDNPKPVALISRLIEFATSKEALVLDFFAGSGTTGQAVLELNRKDGGNRRFILCQLNEVTDTTPNGIAHDVTAKRLKRVMTGECYDGTRDFPWAQKNQPYGGSLEVVDIATVADFNAMPGQSAFDVIDETLYGQPPLVSMEQKVEWVCRNFSSTQTTLENDQEWKARRMEADNR